MGSRRLDLRALPATHPVRLALQDRGVHERASVEFTHDGSRLSGRAGESVASALIANNVSRTARSVKFHRARGPMCMRGQCEGCLVRMDGVPSVLACCTELQDGAEVISQNAFPSAGFDILRVTDWFFPKRFDHHHLMVNLGSAMNRTMQVFARRMSGLGTLPDPGVAPAFRHRRVSCDVLVVGGGLAGATVATLLARNGRKVVLAEQDDGVGGALRDLPIAPDDDALTGIALCRRITNDAVQAGVEVLTSTHVVSSFDDATLAVSGETLLEIVPRVRVFATGGIDGVGLFSGNDLPGVYSARAACRLLLEGVLVGERVAVAGNTLFARSFARAMQACGVAVTHEREATVTAADGNRSVRQVRWQRAGEAENQRVRCDALVIGTMPTPAFELIGQSGAAVVGESTMQVFVPRVEEGSVGRTSRSDVFVAGAVATGHELVWDASSVDNWLVSGGAVAHARAVADEVMQSAVWKG